MPNRSDVSEMLDLSPDVLVPDPHNAKEHTPVQIDQIVASVEAYGFNDPIGVIAQNDGTYLIVEGHGRCEAAKRMGMETIPCLVLPPMTVKERKAYAIAHNQTQLITGLDMDIVSQEFERLDVGTDDHTSLGFTQEDVLFLLPDPSETTPRGADSEFDPEGGGEGGSSGYSNQSFQSFIPPVYKSTLKFGSEGDQLEFYRFVNLLRGRYLTAATIAERFILFIEEFETLPGSEEPTDDAE